MTKEEYIERKNKLEEDYQKAYKKLAYEYAIANSPYKVGDIVTDFVGSLKIEKVKVSTFVMDKNLPYCVYYGTDVNKNGSLAKRNSGRGVIQSNIKSVISQGASSNE